MRLNDSSDDAEEGDMSKPALVVRGLRRELRAYFCGQNIALAIVGIPLLALFSFALMAVAGHPVDGFLALAVGLAALGTALGLSNIFSVVAPYPMERRIGSPVRRAAEGYVGRSLAGTFGSLLGIGVCVVPVVVAVELTSSATAVVRMPVLVAAGAMYGIVLASVGQRHRRERGRTQAARPVPGRHPQQALTRSVK
jgi:ABC-2 type transport system permease protein